MMGKAAELPFDAIITPPAVGSAEEDELAELHNKEAAREANFRAKMGL